MRKLVKKIFSHIRHRRDCSKIKKLQKRNRIEVCESDLHRIELRVEGEGNFIKIGKLASGQGRLILRIFGNDNEVVIADDVGIGVMLHVEIGLVCPNFGAVRETKLHIGAKSSFERVLVKLYNSCSGIYIGEQCMFSYDVNVWNTDAHPIIDLQTGKVCNPSRTLRVGNHVWVGAQATLLKNITIGDDCVVGWGSVVGKSFCDSNCVIAGNPARVIKQGITWNVDGFACGYIDNRNSEK